MAESEGQPEPPLTGPDPAAGISPMGGFVVMPISDAFEDVRTSGYVAAFDNAVLLSRVERCVALRYFPPRASVDRRNCQANAGIVVHIVDRGLVYETRLNAGPPAKGSKALTPRDPELAVFFTYSPARSRLHLIGIFPAPANGSRGKFNLDAATARLRRLRGT